MTWRVIRGDCREVMRSLPERSVHCVVTSPPYWALRDYGVDGQLGLEETPEEFIEKMVAVFAAVKRILRDDGVLWVNLGDSFGEGGNLAGIPWRVALALQADGWILRRDVIWSKPNPMPESVNGWRWERCRVKVGGATTVQHGVVKTIKDAHVTDRHEGATYQLNNQYIPATWTDCPGCSKCEPNGGYVLRKGSGRCTTAHEYLFQFAKTGAYYYDCEAVREDAIRAGDIPGGINRGVGEHGVKPGWGRGEVPFSRNRRSVWEIATEPYPEAHFATYPEALVEPCIKAGTSAKGCCPRCGAPWARVLDNLGNTRTRLRTAIGQDCEEGTKGRAGESYYRTLGWRPTCECIDRIGHDGQNVYPSPVPCTVYDPFTGSGTTGAVAVRLGRDFVGSELNSEYIELAERRIAKAAVKTGIATPEDAAKLTGPVQMGLKL